MRFIRDLDWGNWLYGLFAGGIGGGATAVVAGLGAAQLDGHFKFGFANSIKLIAETFTVGFFACGAFYLKQNSLPHLKTITTTVQTTSPIKPEGKVVTTIEETHTEELPKEKP